MKRPAGQAYQNPIAIKSAAPLSMKDIFTIIRDALMQKGVRRRPRPCSPVLQSLPRYGVEPGSESSHTELLK